MHPRLRRELIWLAVMVAFGFLVLPALIYSVGDWLLGEYRPGAGMGTFYSDLYGAFGRGEPWAWLLLFGPYLGVMALRVLWIPLRRRRRADVPDGDSEAAASQDDSSLAL
ncbi:MAG: hypothetical protein P8080_10125 [Gammaproteobacteria bacterium]